MIKRLLLSIVALTVLGTGVAALSPATALADSKSEICKGVNAASATSGCSDTTLTINNIIGVFLDLFSAIIGIIAVVMIVVGGFKYITANGDSGTITSAKHTIVYALIGLVVVALAQTIVKFVLDKAT